MLLSTHANTDAGLVWKNDVCGNYQKNYWLDY